MGLINKAMAYNFSYLALEYYKKLDLNEGDEVVFDKVLFVDGDSAKVGAPYIEGAKVTGKVLKQGKEAKVLVFKYKSKANYRRLQGHRQPYTKVSIENIVC